MVDYKRYLLKNGLTVILHHDDTTPLAVVNILYKVGSKHEEINRTGLAHLFEHLMFTGTEEVQDFDLPIQKAGGDNNAFTSNDITNYYSFAPSKNLDLLLYLEADRMEKLMIDPTEFEVQKKVVIEEFKETSIDEPYGDIWHHLCKLAYKDHPYKWPVIGLKTADIKKVSKEDARAFYQKHYRPDNAILVVSGNFDEKKAINLISERFENTKNPVSEVIYYEKEKTQLKQRRKTVYKNITVPAIYIAFHIPDRVSQEFYVCDLISDILASGRSARLHEILVKQKKLFSSIDAYTNGTSEEGLLVVDGKLSEGISPEVAESSIFEVLNDLKYNKITERELEKVINKSITTLVFSEYSATNKAMNLAYFESIGDVSLINTEFDIYKNITAEEILNTSAKIFDKRNSNVLYYLSESSKKEKV